MGIVGSGSKEINKKCASCTAQTLKLRILRTWYGTGGGRRQIFLKLDRATST